jgi:hypothetical protein
MTNRRAPKVALVVVLAVALLGASAWLHRDQLPFLHNGSPAAAVQRTAYPRPPVDLHPNDPFWGTAAATFPSGEEGPRWSVCSLPTTRPSYEKPSPTNRTSGCWYGSHPAARWPRSHPG